MLPKTIKEGLHSHSLNFHGRLQWIIVIIIKLHQAQLILARGELILARETKHRKMVHLSRNQALEHQNPASLGYHNKLTQKSNSKHTTPPNINYERNPTNWAHQWFTKLSKKASILIPSTSVEDCNGSSSSSSNCIKHN
ncbi:hypothetical protein GBA52_024764 [Prunus armeniaca]|nr:hypothetical protein GBA52_024764 [Prunus armeniaca]